MSTRQSPRIAAAEAAALAAAMEAPELSGASKSATNADEQVDVSSIGIETTTSSETPVATGEELEEPSLDDGASSEAESTGDTVTLSPQEFMVKQALKNLNTFDFMKQVNLNTCPKHIHVLFMATLNQITDVVWGKLIASLPLLGAEAVKDYVTNVLNITIVPYVKPEAVVTPGVASAPVASVASGKPASASVESDKNERKAAAFKLVEAAALKIRNTNVDGVDHGTGKLLREVVEKIGDYIDVHGTSKPSGVRSTEFDSAMNTPGMVLEHCINLKHLNSNDGSWKNLADLLQREKFKRSNLTTLLITNKPSLENIQDVLHASSLSGLSEDDKVRAIANAEALGITSNEAKKKAARSKDTKICLEMYLAWLDLIYAMPDVISDFRHFIDYVYAASENFYRLDENHYFGPGSNPVGLIMEAFLKFFHTGIAPTMLTVANKSGQRSSAESKILRRMNPFRSRLDLLEFGKFLDGKTGADYANNNPLSTMLKKFEDAEATITRLSELDGIRQATVNSNVIAFEALKLEFASSMRGFAETKDGKKGKNKKTKKEDDTRIKSDYSAAQLLAKDSKIFVNKQLKAETFLIAGQTHNVCQAFRHSNGHPVTHGSKYYTGHPLEEFCSVINGHQIVTGIKATRGFSDANFKGTPPYRNLQDVICVCCVDAAGTKAIHTYTF